MTETVPRADRHVRFRLTDIVLALALAVATCAVFWPVCGHAFLNWDDLDLIRDNPAYNPPRLDALPGFWTRSYLGFYVPVPYSVWGIVAWADTAVRDRGAQAAPDPHVFHALSLAMHVAAVVLAYILLRQWLRDRPGASIGAAIGAAFFALHPLQVEPVAWATNMYTPLSTALALLAAWLYDRSVRAQDEQRTAAMLWLYGSAAGAFVLSTLTKSSTVVLPLVLAAVDVWLLGRDWRLTIARLAPWLALAVPAIALTLLLHDAPYVKRPPILARPLIAADALAFYLTKVVWPARLIPDYGRSPQWLLGRTEMWLTWLVPAAAIALCIALRRRAPVLVAGFAVFVISLLPMLGITSFDFQTYSTVADRYVYLALLGPALIMAVAVAGQPIRWPAAAAGLAVVVVLAALTRHQVHYWRDSHTLFEHTLIVNPSSVGAHRVLAFTLATERDDAGAAEHYRAALHLKPDDAFSLYNLGNLYARQRRFDEAVEQYRRAVEIDPRNLRAANNLAVALALLGREDEALRELERVLHIDPRNADALTNRAVVYQQRGETKAAIDSYRAALRINPNHPQARKRLEELGAGP